MATKARTNKQAQQAQAQAEALKAAAEYQRRKNNVVPANIPSTVSHASDKPIQKLAAKINGRLHKEFTAWWIAGHVAQGDHTVIAVALATARNENAPTKAQVKSAYETIGRLIDAGILASAEAGYTLAIPADLNLTEL